VTDSSHQHPAPDGYGNHAQAPYPATPDYSGAQVYPGDPAYPGAQGYPGAAPVDPNAYAHQGGYPAEGAHPGYAQYPNAQYPNAQYPNAYGEQPTTDGNYYPAQHGDPYAAQGQAQGWAATTDHIAPYDPAHAHGQNTQPLPAQHGPAGAHPAPGAHPDAVGESSDEAIQDVDDAELIDDEAAGQDPNPNHRK
jgi:hypothetical protein